MDFTISPKIYLLSLWVASASLTGCDKACDKDSVPQYVLTSQERNWANPYVENTVWSFRNPSGYVRTYRVAKLADVRRGEGGGKNNFCPNNYRQEVTATMVRTDSVAPARENSNYFTMLAPGGTQGFIGGIAWSSSHFSVGIDEIEKGQIYSSTYQVLPSVIITGRTYPQVVVCAVRVLPMPQPSAVTHIYFTKADGVIRFEDKNGTVWDRI